MKADISTSYPRTVLRRRVSLFSVFQALDRQFRQRQALGRLDPHLRKDVGLSDVDILQETRRPPWDAPSWWY